MRISNHFASIFTVYEVLRHMELIHVGVNSTAREFSDPIAI